MKKFMLALAGFCFLHSAFAQKISATTPKATLKWAPAGLATGSISLQGEYKLGRKSSLTAKVGIPSSSRHTFQFQDNDAVVTAKATSVLAGYRMYLSKRSLKGIYLEPYVKYLQHDGVGTGTSTLDGKPVIMNVTNRYTGMGAGAQLGAQFIISKRAVIDLFLIGPEINSATNHFKAAEATSSLPWSSMEADDVEQDLRNFVNQFPFLRNNTQITVDKNNRTVTADFKGALPGFRAGLSIGIAL